MVYSKLEITCVYCGERFTNDLAVGLRNFRYLTFCPYCKEPNEILVHSTVAFKPAAAKTDSSVEYNSFTVGKIGRDESISL